MVAFLAVALAALLALLAGAVALDLRSRTAGSRAPARGADALDLHGFPPPEIPGAVLAYLEDAASRGLREVRLIHGKGRGVQRQRVQELLREHPLVEEFFDAPPARGGWGATIAVLRERGDASV